MKNFTILFLVIAVFVAFLGCSRNYNYRSQTERFEAAKYYFNQGMYAIERQNASFALPNFTEALRILPDFGDAYYQRARIYEAAKLPVEALSDFEKAQKFSKRYQEMSKIEPLGFELTEADLQIIKSEPAPKDAISKADKMKPLEKLRSDDKVIETSEE